MKIGELAKMTGCHVESIRYYARVGLIPSARKADNGYGVYSDAHLKLLRLIRSAKNLGFSQGQIRELCQLATRRHNVCDEIHQMTVTQISLIEQKLQDLYEMKNTLKQFSRACEKNSENFCPVIEKIVSD